MSECFPAQRLLRRVWFRADGAIREDARPASYGFSTSAHPFRVLENARPGSTRLS